MSASTCHEMVPSRRLAQILRSLQHIAGFTCPPGAGAIIGPLMFIGPGWVTVAAPVTHAPLFVRTGASVALPDPRTLGLPDVIAGSELIAED